MFKLLLAFEKLNSNELVRFIGFAIESLIKQSKDKVSSSFLDSKGIKEISMYLKF